MANAVCPKCGSSNIDFQLFQEKKTISKTKSKYKEKGHGCLWWVCIGWWWWMIDLILWIFLFFPRLLISLFRKKKYTGHSTTVTSEQNKYQTICICRDCGHNWKK